MAPFMLLSQEGSTCEQFPAHNLYTHGLACRAEAFAAAMGRLVADPAACRTMGTAARAHVAKSFSRTAFGSSLEAHMRGLLGGANAGSDSGKGKKAKKQR